MSPSPTPEDVLERMVAHVAKGDRDRELQFTMDWCMILARTLEKSDRAEAKKSAERSWQCWEEIMHRAADRRDVNLVRRLHKSREMLKRFFSPTIVVGMLALQYQHEHGSWPGDERWCMAANRAWNNLQGIKSGMSESAWFAAKKILGFTSDLPGR